MDIPVGYEFAGIDNDKIKIENNMEIKDRKTIWDNLSKYTYTNDKDAFIEVCEWTNGEGCDITIGTSNETKLISLHMDELEAINYLVKSLIYKDK